MSLKNALLIPLLLAGCTGGEYTGLNTPGAETAQLTLLNAVSDSQSVRSIVLDGSTLTLPTPGSALGIAIDAGFHLLSITGANGQAAAQATFSVGVGGRRTAFFTDASAGVLLKVSTDTASLPSLGKAKIRVVHLAEGTTPVDAYLYAMQSTPTEADRYMSAFGFGQGTNESFPGFTERDSGTYLVRITNAGSMVTLVESPPIQLHEGEIWSVILSRFPTGTLGLLPVQER